MEPAQWQNPAQRHVQIPAEQQWSNATQYYPPQSDRPMPMLAHGHQAMQPHKPTHTPNDPTRTPPRPPASTLYRPNVVSQPARRPPPTAAAASAMPKTGHKLLRIEPPPVTPTATETKASITPATETEASITRENEAAVAKKFKAFREGGGGGDDALQQAPRAAPQPVRPSVTSLRIDPPPVRPSETETKANQATVAFQKFKVSRNGGAGGGNALQQTSSASGTQVKAKKTLL